MAGHTEAQNSHLAALLEELTALQSELAQYADRVATLTKDVHEFHTSLTHSYDQAAALADEARQVYNDTAALIAQSRLLIETLKKEWER